MKGGWIAFAVALGVGLHWPGPDAQFTLDDFQFITQNQSIRSLAGALASFDEPFPPGQHDRGLYRPITNLSYAIDHLFWRVDPRGYHISNALLYGLSIGLVFRLARSYRLGVGLALATALIFGLHPVHSEAVDAVAGRSELLSLIFSLASLLCFKRALSAAGLRSQAADEEVLDARFFAPGLASLLFYALACLSKETSVLLPALLGFEGLLAWIESERRSPRGLQRVSLALLPFALLASIYLALRYSVIGRFAPLDPVLAGHDFGARLLTMGMAFSENLRVLFHPELLETDLYYSATLAIPEAMSASIALGWLSGLSILAGAGWLFARHMRRDESESDGQAFSSQERHALLAGVAIFFCFLLPVSHVFDFGAVFAERFVFSPSLGFCLIVPIISWRAVRAVTPSPRAQRAIALAGLIVFVGVAGSRSHERALDWRDEVRLWSRAQERLPDNAPILANLGLAHFKRGNLEEAERWLRDSLARDSGNLPGWNSLASVLLEKGELDAAQAIFRRVVEVDDDNFMAWNNLGVVEARRQNHSVAARMYREAIARNPHYASARQNLAEVEVAIGEARDYLASFSQPPSAEADPALLLRYSHACFVVGDFPCASDYHQRWQARDAASRQTSGLRSAPTAEGVVAGR
jgi:tetratricopeptide (TPR) repeat protein